MTAPLPPDDLITAVLERRAASASADGLLDEVVYEIESLPTRAGGAANPTPWGAALLAAFVLAIALGVGPRNLGSGTPAATPEASPTVGATPTEAGVRPVVAAGIDGPPLSAGRWRSAAYEPGVEFTVPAGVWTAGIDIPRQFWLRAHLPGAPASEFDALTVLTVTNVYVEPCERGEEETRSWTDADPDAFLDWLAANTGQELGPRRPVTVLGLRAIEVEFTSNVGPDCVAGYVPITDNGRLAPFSSPPEGQRVRYAVTSSNGLTVLIATWTDDPTRWADVRAAADAVLATMEFVP